MLVINCMENLVKDSLSLPNSFLLPLVDASFAAQAHTARELVTTLHHARMFQKLFY